MYRWYTCPSHALPSSCDFLLNTFWRAPAREELRIAELPNIMVLEPALEDAIRESKAKPKPKSKSTSHREETPFSPPTATATLDRTE